MNGGRRGGLIITDTNSLPQDLTLLKGNTKERKASCHRPRPFLITNDHDFKFQHFTRKLLFLVPCNPNIIWKEPQPNKGTLGEDPLEPRNEADCLPQVPFFKSYNSLHRQKLTKRRQRLCNSNFGGKQIPIGVHLEWDPFGILIPLCHYSFFFFSSSSSFWMKMSRWEGRMKGWWTRHKGESRLRLLYSQRDPMICIPNSCRYAENIMRVLALRPNNVNPNQERIQLMGRLMHGKFLEGNNKCLSVDFEIALETILWTLESEVTTSTSTSSRGRLLELETG